MADGSSAGGSSEAGGQMTNKTNKRCNKSKIPNGEIENGPWHYYDAQDVLPSDPINQKGTLQSL